MSCWRPTLEQAAIWYEGRRLTTIPTTKPQQRHKTTDDGRTIPWATNRESSLELTWRRQCTIAFSTNHNNKMEVNACLCINLILSTMFRFTTPYLRSNQLRSVGFLVGFLAGGKLLSSLQSSKPRHSRQLSEDNVPHSGQQGGSSHVKYFRIL
jgi:hypothetical protein